MILEQGFAVDELVEDQLRTRGTRRVGWASIVIHRRCSMEECCTTRLLELSDGGGVTALREGDILRKLASTAATEVPRREYDRGQNVWWEAHANHPWRSRDTMLCHHRRNALTMTAGARRVRVLCNAQPSGDQLGWQKQMREARSR